MATSTRKKTTPRKSREGKAVRGQGRRLREIMSESVQTIAPDADIVKAAEIMKATGVGAIPVCESDRLLGMLTDRDIAIRVVAERRDPQNTMVRDAMTPEVISCFEDQDVEEAAVLMREQQIRRIPVLSKERKLVGVVSLGDLAIETSRSDLASDALKGVSQPGGAHYQ